MDLVKSEEKHLRAAVLAVGNKSRNARKRSKKIKQGFSIYIHRVLKEFHPNITISKKSMSIVNSFVNNMFEKIAFEASRLARYNKRLTIGSLEIQTAVSLLLPKELAMNAISEGTMAVVNYKRSRGIIQRTYCY